MEGIDTEDSMRIYIIWYRYDRYSEAQIGRCFSDFEEAQKAAEILAKDTLDQNSLSVKHLMWTDSDDSFVRIVTRSVE